ncbi:SNF2 family helicase ATPase [Cordyceps militaris]|uniref:SNF2 family helicase ATPase n=1 Tax=Cordyceps militaris TaxID=73501 RepID=A0A2H4SHA0_CORMI|nr:SNF2 family helicase ATPase [Cordyceps militaris]
MDVGSSSDAESIMSKAKDGSSPASSPPPARSPQAQGNTKDAATAETINEDQLVKEEEQARLANNRAEEKRRQTVARKRRTQKATTKAEREAQARQLDELLTKSAAFSDILTKKTQVLGRVGSGLDGQTLGEHDLQMATQPKCLVGGTMRDYQLEGLTWMYEICSQGMSGILADEMGLGKTVQTISLIALLREQENYLGPHLIVAPLSTLSNWMDEFDKWTPSIPVVMYHGTPQQRQQIYSKEIMKHLQAGRPTEKFPVVCTSYEMVLQDKAFLSRIDWEFIIIDEGHRMKNADAKLFKELQQFTSATRLLITGTPLQNNLKELWSLLHFLLPNIFTDWDSFESWFDFSGLEDEEGTQEFIQDQMKQDLVRKMHLILQPLLLRRIKQDVAAYLPQKREYVLFAPMTKEQTDLYNVFSNADIDPREFLQNKVEKLIMSAKPTQQEPKSNGKQKKISLPVRESPRSKQSEANRTELPAAPNAFARMMGKATLQTSAKPKQENATPIKSGSKRKSQVAAVAEPESKSARSSRGSTPASTRGRPRKSHTYKEADSENEDELSDAEFEAKLVQEMGSAEDSDREPDSRTPEEIQRAERLDLAKKQIAAKKLGNAHIQQRLACNSPHNFYNPWAVATDTPVDASIVTSSGKMLLLDRLLRHLLARGHKVLLFSQFTTQLDILEDYCRELRGWPVCRVDGGVSQPSRRAQIHAFNTDPAHQLFLLSTRAGGQGINLASADTVVLFDSDFNPQQDLQAQDRCHRIGQLRPVIVYRLATRGTVEEQLLLAADAKRRLEKLVIRKGGFKSMGQKMNGAAADAARLDEKTLELLLLKDGQVFETTGGEDILSEADLSVLCDRSDAAYEKAASGETEDAEGYCVVETGSDSIKMNFKSSKE